MSLPKPTLVLGHDPGISGSFAVYDMVEKTLVEVWDMPRSPDHAFNAKGAANSIERYAPRIRFACVEDVGAMTYVNAYGEKRGQGAAASFAFGRYAGTVHGILAAFKISMFLVRPAVWKSIYGLSGDKNLSLKMARELFPDHAAQFSRKKDDGRAEAALLALFGAERIKT